MSEFMICPKKIISGSEYFFVVEKKLRTSEDAIRSICHNYALHGKEAASIKKVLTETANTLENMAANFQKSGSSLNEIGQLYQSTEMHLNNFSSESPENAFGNTEENSGSYQKYKQEVDDCISELSGKHGLIKALLLWKNLIEKASFTDPVKCSLTKAEKESLLTVLCPLLLALGKGSQYLSDTEKFLIDHIPFLKNLKSMLNGLLNSTPANNMENFIFSSANQTIQFLFGFAYNAKTDSYYTVEDSIQNQWGFSDAMDHMGPALGMDLDTTISTFTYGGREFRVQLWKGTYGYGNAVGGEFGLYSRPEWEAQERPYIEGSKDSLNILYDAVDEEYQLPVAQVVSYDSEFNRPKKFVNDTSQYGDGDHYWNLNIRTESGVPKSSIHSQYTIDCREQDSGFCDAMYESLLKEKTIKVKREGNVIFIEY